MSFKKILESFSKLEKQEYLSSKSLLEQFDDIEEKDDELIFIDNRKKSIINNDPSFDPGFDEFDIKNNYVIREDKEVSNFTGTLGNVLEKHSDELNKLTSKEDIFRFLDQIEPEVDQKKYLERTKANLAKKRDFISALTYLYDIIQKGHNDGVITESRAWDTNWREKGLELADEMDREGVYNMLLATFKWMSNEDVGEMLHQNGYLEYENVDESFKSINEALDENPIISWLGEHEQAWEDFTVHFSERDIEELSDEEIISWISDHDQLYADFKAKFNYLDESFEKKLKECLSKLNEAEMSDEDKRDTEILKGIYNKTQKRANAKLTPEEQNILAKYGLERNSDYKTVKIPNEWGEEADLFRDSDKETNRYKSYYGKTQRSIQSGAKDINYADRARKMPDRKYARDLKRNTHTHVWNIEQNNIPTSAFKKPLDDRDPEYKGRFIDKERATLDSEASKNVRKMKWNLQDRKAAQSKLDTIDKDYDAKIQAIKDKAEKEIANAERGRETNRAYSQKSFDRSQERIDQLLKRK